MRNCVSEPRRGVLTVVKERGGGGGADPLYFMVYYIVQMETNVWFRDCWEVSG